MNCGMKSARLTDAGSSTRALVFSIERDDVADAVDVVVSVTLNPPASSAPVQRHIGGDVDISFVVTGVPVEQVLVQRAEPQQRWNLLGEPPLNMSTAARLEPGEQHRRGQAVHEARRGPRRRTGPRENTLVRDRHAGAVQLINPRLDDVERLLVGVECLLGPVEIVQRQNRVESRVHRLGAGEGEVAVNLVDGDVPVDPRMHH